MKKFISLLLALAMVLSLAACGIPASRPPKGEIKPLEQNEKAPEKQEEQTQPTEEAQPTEDNSFSLGAMQGGIYENTYAGFGCQLDSTWVYMTAEELQDISEITMDKFEGTELDPSAYDQIMDMMAECSERLTTINIQYTSLNPQDRITHRMIGEEGVVDQTLEYKDLIISTYSQIGIEVSSMEKVEITFCGEERFAIHTAASIEGMPYYLLQLFNTNIGPYYVTVTLASYVEDSTYDLLDLFYKLG